MNNTNRTKRNIIIFTIFSTLCGWIGYFVDKLTGQAHYENIGTMAGEEPLGMLIWLVSPLICTMVLRTFGGDGWKNAGFAFNFKNNKILYLISFLVYPVVTIIVILLGVITKGIRFSNMSIGLTAYFGILFTQITIQFIKNIFEESVWRAYLTNQLLKLKLSDLKIYLLIGFIWWLWHLPYIMIFLSESEIQNTLPVGRLTFFLIGTIVVTVWTIMYTEIFRITKSVWPLVIAHTMEDAVINPLLLLGIVSLVTGFKDCFNTTINEYTQKVRMTRALELLYNDELSIVEIAQAVGYYGDGYFQKAFKETYGISPARMRKDL